MTVDVAKNVNSEALFLGANVVESKCIRGGENIKICFTQLSKRLIDIKTDQPVTKEKHKSFNAGKSPDEGDTFCYLTWLAHKRGFRSGDTTKKKISTSDKFRNSRKHNARMGIKLSRH